MTQLKRVKIGKIDTTLLLLVGKMSTLVIPSDISKSIFLFEYNSKKNHRKKSHFTPFYNISIELLSAKIYKRITQPKQIIRAKTVSKLKISEIRKKNALYTLLLNSTPNGF